MYRCSDDDWIFLALREKRYPDEAGRDKACS